MLPLPSAGPNTVAPLLFPVSPILQKVLDDIDARWRDEEGTFAGAHRFGRPHTTGMNASAPWTACTRQQACSGVMRARMRHVCPSLACAGKLAAADAKTAGLCSRLFNECYGE